MKLIADSPIAICDEESVLGPCYGHVEKTQFIFNLGSFCSSRNEFVLGRHDKDRIHTQAFGFVHGQYVYERWVNNGLVVTLRL